MKVRMRTLMAGPDGVHSPGDMADLPNEQAIAMIDGGYADPAREVAVETAVSQEYEKAAKRKKAMRDDD